MFRIWLPSFYVFTGLLAFMFKSIFFYKLFIYLTYPISRLFDMLPFSVIGRGYGNSTGYKYEVYYIESPLLPSPLKLPTEHFMLILIILISVFLWFLIGLVIDKRTFLNK